MDNDEVGGCVLILYVRKVKLRQYHQLQRSFLSSQHKKTTTAETDSRIAQSSFHVDPETQAWRFGPAQMWYDSLGVSEDGSNLDYGFKLKVLYTYYTSHVLMYFRQLMGHQKMRVCPRH